MFKPNKMVKVVSIILMILSVLGVILVIGGYAMLPKMEQLLEQSGANADILKEAYQPLSLAISILGSVLLFVCGILGVRGKGFKAAVVLMVIYLIYVTVTIVQTTLSTGFSFMAVIDYILPILYLWGLYQSKE